jgi:hypothetical protein
MQIRVPPHSKGTAVLQWGLQTGPSYIPVELGADALEESLLEPDTYRWAEQWFEIG